MPWPCRVLAVAVSVLFAQTPPAPSRELLTSIVKLYAGLEGTKLTMQLFNEREPAKAALHGQQFKAWVERQGLSTLEQRAKAILTPAQLSGVQRRMADSRPQFERILSNNPKLTFEQVLNGQAFQIRDQSPQDYALVFGEGGAAAGGPVARGASPGGSQLVYTVADLNSLLAGAMDRAAGKPSDKQEAGVAELQRLGRIVLTGTTNAKSGRMLEFDDGVFTGRWTVYLTRFSDAEADDAIDSHKGKPITVSCVVNKVKIFIEMTQCAFVRSAEGLTPAKVPLNPAGLRRTQVASEAFLATPGAGLRPDEIDGIYLIQAYRAGFGGYLTYQTEPVLLLRGGLLYDEPHYAPDRFNAKLSQQREPQNWGKATVAGKKAHVVWMEANRGDPDTDYSQFTKATPGPPGLRLNGSYGHMTGTGNLAVGGNQSVVATNNISFTPDGRFVRGAASGASAPGVAVSTRSKERAGTYRVDGWSIVLTYDDGKQEALLFASVDDTFEHIFVGSTLFLKSKGRGR